MTLEIGEIKLKGGDSSAKASVKAQVKDAEKRKQSATETLEEAWERILSSKGVQTNASKLRRMREVRDAMLAGEIGREPVPEGKKQGKFSAAEAERLWKVVNERNRERKLQEMVDNTPENYELITDVLRFHKLINLLESEPIVAIDTETTGVDVYTDEMVGLSITLPNADWHIYIPFGHDEGVQLNRDYVIEGLRDFLYSESIGKVLHNAMFDIAMFRRHGYDLKGVAWDTMTAMHILNENEPSFKLKDLAPRYLGVESDTFDELFKGKLFSEIPLDIALVYAAKDTHLTWDLYEFQLRHLEKMPSIFEYYREVEVPILYVIVDLEANGYILDLDFAEEYGEKLHDRAEELRQELIEVLSPYHEGEGVLNLNSPAQMKPALSSCIGKELPNMDAKKTLKPLRDKYPIIDKLLEYKTVTKLSGTYIDTLPTKQNPTTKRWHSRFNPMGTVTGRFSSGKDEENETGREFNVQNQPPEARPMFVAPKGKVIVGADFKAQEIRCVAYMSQEPVLIEAFRTGRDPYAMMAATFYKRPYEEVYKNEDGSDTPERKKMKVVWLATLYGMSDFSLGDTLGISRKEATEFKEEIFGSMPKLNAWLKENEDFVRKYGFVWADKKARKRRLPDAKLRKKRIPYGKWNDPAYKEQRMHNASINRAMRQATNARVQGSSSIQTKVTMVKAHEYCQTREGWALWGTVHDELLFEIPEDFTPEDLKAIEDLMLYAYPWGDSVPNGTDLEIMRKWGEGVPPEAWDFERHQPKEGE